MTPTLRSQRIPRRGMTLIEVMIALTILTGAILGMGRFITGFSHSASDGALTSTASDLVLDRLELVKAARPYSSLPTFAITEASVVGNPTFRRVTQVMRTNTAQTDYTAITVTVTNPAMSKPVKKSTIVAAF